MRTDQLAKNLAKHLQKKIDVEVVAHPNHPFLFDSPDFLVALPGNLVGIFVLRVTESNSSDLLFTRLAVSRLVMPYNFRCVLVIPDKISNKVNATPATYHFHEVLLANELKGLESFIQDEHAKGEAVDIPPEEKSKAFERFQLFFSESLKNVKFENKQNVQGNKKSKEKREIVEYVEKNFHFTEINNWKLFKYSDQKKRISSRLFSKEKEVIGIVSDRMTNTINEKIKPLCRDILQLSYVLDRGVPHLIDQTANLLITESLPTQAFDVEKPARAAAFAGWVMTSNDNEDLVSEQLYKVSEITNKLK